MNVVTATGIWGQVTDSIHVTASSIAQIELTSEEMEELLATPQFKTYIDKHYAGYELPVPLSIAPVKAEGDIPRSCFYMGTLLVRVDP